MEDKLEAFQDFYPDDYSHCYGCGRLNEHGMQIKSYWDGEESVCRIHPRDYYTGGMKHIVYGGLIASLIDCHAAGTAAAAKIKELGEEMTRETMPRFVTANLNVNFKAPTPIGAEIELRGKVLEIKGRKVTIGVDLIAEGVVCAEGQALMIQVKETV
ncbi:Thioesterase superfamily protein [Desulfatibacillum alkenivorans DSM 16219]|jgi:acyl-coenzyme A thioesterase PaaI-like protein|uniref:Acyl-coenzyme A thioesterase THEM4 n=1 Tax=Desulfatibacillum alkenivorans DSM 16219 TaxID=1121393 RepID=A0A1M6GQE5_9BACT|nr:PaaI family thioesterase [Desulfatibacillum alkenivorans]SHJ12181.1 Thioesterase superfamily protein [Desulfatibacillum alkenivorans DSM 16219]